MRPDRRRLAPRALVPLAVTALLATALAATPGTAHAVADTTPWQSQVVSTPYPSVGVNGYPSSLDDITAISATEVVAVGHVMTSVSPPTPRAEILTSSANTTNNGTIWPQNTTPTPLDGAYQSSLSAVDAVNSANVWTAGWSESGPGTPWNPVIRRRVTGGWTSVPVPTLGTNGATLSGIDMLNVNSGWAVGESWDTEHPNASQNVILHWNGTTWTKMSVPSEPGGYNGLYSVTATGPNDVWAVGGYSPSGFTNIAGTRRDNVILHWDGASWQLKTPKPTTDLNPRPASSPGAVGNLLHHLVVVSATEAYAMGTQITTSWIQRVPLVLKWDGTSWTPFTHDLNDGGLGWDLTDAQVISPTEIYFVGYQHDTSWDIVDHEFARRWDGTQFVAETLPTAPTGNVNGDRVASALSSVTGLPNGQTWIAGHTRSNKNQVLYKDVTP
ncbi:MAG: hypothetical protein QOI78_2706 [Actinomycetota bacterium]|nr:hypothetical protein [Actinomycetota bacterium]